MKNLKRLVLIGSIVILLVSSLTSVAIPDRDITVQFNEEETDDLPQNRQHIT